LFEIVIKSEESMVVNSHFKSFVINHGPKSVLGGFFIVNNLTGIFVSFKEFYFISIQKINFFILSQINNHFMGFFTLKVSGISKVTSLFIIGHCVSTSVL